MDELEDDFGPLFDVQVCRVCGCTDDEACEGGCEWVEEDLCSQCAPSCRVCGKDGAQPGSWATMSLCTDCAERPAQPHRARIVPRQVA